MFPFCFMIFFVINAFEAFAFCPFIISLAFDFPLFCLENFFLAINFQFCMQIPCYRNLHPLDLLHPFLSFFSLVEWKYL